MSSIPEDEAELEQHADSGDQKRTTGLKLVTVAPSSSMVDTDLAEIEAAASRPGSRDPYVGCTIDDRYKVEKVLGEGGMGVVYKCSHKIIGKKVAMKVLRSDLARDAEVTERFLNEAKAASAIGNVHIIDISDFGQLPDGSAYFVMEFLDGQPLADAVEGGKSLPVARIVHIARQICEGLQAAHDAGIVHRDLKPDNIYLIERAGESDFVKILDFGIAKVSTSEGKLTRAGSVFGTPHYMSPEQAAGAPVDHRGDIYSVGVILYELASGKVPFDADNFMGILTQHMYKAPVPFRQLVPNPQDIPPGLEAIVLKCLSKRAEQRYQTMAELLSDLDRLMGGNVPEAVPEMMQRSGGFNVPADYFKKAAMPAPVPATPGEARSRSKWPVYAGVAGVLAAVGIVSAIFITSASSTAQPSTSPPAATGEPSSDEADESAPAKTPGGTQVAIAVSPIDAQAFRGDENLGSSPVVINVPEGEKVEVEFRREGYESLKLTVDDSLTKRTVKLSKLEEDKPKPPVGGGFAAPKPVAAKPQPKPAARPKPTPKPKPKGSSIGGGEIVDPWK